MPETIFTTTDMPETTLPSTSSPTATSTTTVSSTSTSTITVTTSTSNTTVTTSTSTTSSTPATSTTKSTPSTTKTTVPSRKRRSVEVVVPTVMSPEQPAMNETSIPICVLGILLFMSGIVTNFLLFRAVKKDREGLIMLWLVWTALLGVFVVINVVESVYKTKAVIGVVHLIIAPIIVCCWVVVFYFSRVVDLSKEYNVQGNVDKSSYQELRNMDESSNII